MKAMYTHLLLCLLLAMPVVAEAQATIPAVPREYGSERSASDFTDAEIERFGTALKNLESLQEAAAVEIELMLKTHGYDSESFQALAERIQDRDADPKPTEEERSKFFRISEEVQGVKLGMQPKMTQVLADQQIEVNDFEDLNKAYQNDEAFRKRVQKAMRP